MDLQLAVVRQATLAPLAVNAVVRQATLNRITSQSPYFVNLLMGGYDKENGPELYFMDYLASSVKCLLGIQCNDFVMIAADQTTSHSIMVMKDDEEKIYKISDRLVMGIIGDLGDTTQFAEYIAKNIQLYKMRNGYELGPSAAANFTRRNLAEYLRSSSPYFVNLLMGGYDKENGPELYFMDYLASSVKVPFCAHGFGGYLSLSIMDRYHKKDATEEEAYEILKKCVQEVHRRLFVSLPNFQVTVVNRDGIKAMPVINSALLK